MDYSCCNSDKNAGQRTYQTTSTYYFDLLKIKKQITSNHK